DGSTVDTTAEACCALTLPAELGDVLDETSLVREPMDQTRPATLGNSKRSSGAAIYLSLHPLPVRLMAKRAPWRPQPHFPYLKTARHFGALNTQVSTQSKMFAL